MYFNFGVKCVSVTQGMKKKNYILTAATGDESLDLSLFFFLSLSFGFPVLCTLL